MNAPESQLAQAPASRPRSTLERIALVMLGLVALNALWIVFGLPNLLRLLPPSNGRSFMVAYLIVGAVPPLAFFAGLLWRKKWARIGWMALTLLGIAFLVLPSMILQQRIEFSFASTAGLVLQILALCLLFIDDRKRGLRRQEVVHA